MFVVFIWFLIVYSSCWVLGVNNFRFFQECYGIIKSVNVIVDVVLGDIFRDLENIYLLDFKFFQELEERMKIW